MSEGGGVKLHERIFALNNSLYYANFGEMATIKGDRYLKWKKAQDASITKNSKIIFVVRKQFFLFVFDIVGMNHEDGIFLTLFRIISLGLKSGFRDGHENVIVIGKTIDYFLHNLLLLKKLLLRVSHVLSDHLAQVPVDNLTI